MRCGYRESGPKPVIAQLARQLDVHPDNRFDAFVLADTLRTDRARLHPLTPDSPAIIAVRQTREIGDCRARFRTPEALTCLAGVAPSTRQSGTVKYVGFRWAADKQLRDAVCDFAGGSRRANPWAADLYTRARVGGHDYPHAVRILARARLHIIWHCWQTTPPTIRPTTEPSTNSSTKHPAQG